VSRAHDEPLDGITDTVPESEGLTAERFNTVPDSDSRPFRTLAAAPSAGLNSLLQKQKAPPKYPPYPIYHATGRYVTEGRNF